MIYNNIKILKEVGNMIDREKTFNEMWNSMRADEHFADMNDFDLEITIDEWIEDMIEDEQQEETENEILIDNNIKSQYICPKCGINHKQVIIETKENENTFKICLECENCGAEYTEYADK
jgi:predicted RNA-binding Zn-ribbon protein involved in translation (DUF1610 family)